MPEINLLPDELRDKEEKELDLVRRKPKRINIDMSSPKRQQVNQPLKAAKPSLVSRLFSRTTKPASLMNEEEEVGLAVKPEVSDRPIEKKINLTRGGFGGFGGQSAKSEISVEPEEKTEFGRQRGASFGQITDRVENDAKNERTEVKITGDFGKSKREKPRRPFIFSLFARKKKVKSEMSPDSAGPEISSKEDRKRQRDTMVDVNLIPAELDSHPELNIPQKFTGFVSVVIAAVVLVVVTYLGVVAYQINIGRQINSIENDIVSLDKQLAALEGQRQEALEFQNYLEMVRELLNNHVYWTKFFEIFEKHTHQQVYYSNFSMSGRSNLVISAAGRDYNTVAEQLVELQQADDFAESVSISAAQLRTGTGGAINGVDFTINLQFVPDLFLKPIDE